MSGPIRPNTLGYEDRRIRMVAESVVNASIASPRAYPQSVMTPDVYSEILVGGFRNDGRMSNVRRFFCLFITFDFLFTVLLWMFCIVISGANVQMAFLDEILHYKIKTSLFDVVAVAALRFIILWFFYAALHINHWFVVAFTTTSTCAFLLAKIFLYTWTTSHQPLFEVLFMLTSFVLVWSEVWFLDIKVIPYESLVRDWSLSQTNPNERAPLLVSNSLSASAAAVSQENVGHYYTPMDSPDHSDDEHRSSTNRKDSSSSLFLSINSPIKLPQDKIEEIKKRALALPKRCFDIITSPDWKIEKTTSDGDVISYMHLPKPDGKIFKITGIVEDSAVNVINELYDNIETAYTWNKQVSEAKKIYVINETMDLIYQGTTALANGAVDPRDFVILRHRTELNSYFMSCGSSVDFAILPSRKNYVRGENGSGCFATRVLSNDSCEFTWLLNTHLKGWIPQKMVDMFMPLGMVEFIGFLRQHMRELKN